MFYVEELVTYKGMKNTYTLMAKIRVIELTLPYAPLSPFEGDRADETLPSS